MQRDGSDPASLLPSNMVWMTPGCVMALSRSSPQASAGRELTRGLWGLVIETKLHTLAGEGDNAWPKGCRAPVIDHQPARVACTRPASPPRAAEVIVNPRTAAQAQGIGHLQQGARFLQQLLGPLQGQYLQIAFGRHPAQRLNSRWK